MANVLYTLSDQAKREFVSTLQWSERNFGAEAAIRYKELLKVSFVKVGENPSLIGSYNIDRIKLFHIRHCRKLAPVDGLIVKNPRHFLLYRENGKSVDILRILHDQMNIEAILKKG